MSINKYKSWSRLLGDLKTKKNLFKEPCENEFAKYTLAAVATIAKIIATRAPDLLKKDSMRICVAGAQTHDTINGGDLFNLLPELLSDFTNYHLDLVGDKVDVNEIAHQGTELKRKSKQVVVTKYISLLGSYLSENTPDVIILLHPGFEEYHNSWLVDDNGIEAALSKKIKVFGASYGDESPIDKLYTNAHGYNIFNIQNNLFSRPLSEISVPNHVSQNIFVWAAQTWEIEKTSDHDNEFITELIPFLSEMLTARAAEEENPVSSYYTSTLMNTQGQFFNIFSDIYISFTEGAIISTDGPLICEDVEIDVSDIVQYKEYQFLYLTLKCAIAYKEYLKPALLQADDSSDQDLDKMTSEIFEQTGNHSGLRPITLSNKKIIPYFEKYEGIHLVNKLKSNFEINELSDFLDNEKYSLLHVACALNNLPLIEFSKEIGIDPDQRNSDMYSPLDICVADGGIEGLKSLIKSYPEINLDAAGAWGFTALHHTKIRRKPDMADVLKSHGAKDTIKNHAGLAYRDM